MAQTRPGGVYKVGDAFVNANGEPVDAPTRKETDEQRKADEQSERELEQAFAQQRAAAAAQQPEAPARRAGR